MHGGHETDNMACTRFCHIALARLTAAIHAVPFARRLTSLSRCRGERSRSTIGARESTATRRHACAPPDTVGVGEALSFSRSCVRARHADTFSPIRLRNYVMKISAFRCGFRVEEEKKDQSRWPATRGSSRIAGLAVVVLLWSWRSNTSHVSSMLPHESLSERLSRPAAILACRLHAGSISATCSVTVRNVKMAIESHSFNRRCTSRDRI